MFQWWESLNGVERFFMYVAIPSTVVLILQTILTIIGLGGDTEIDVPDIDTDFDTEIDTASYLEDMTTAADFRFFSIRGMVAFLTVFGWSGAAVYQSSQLVLLSIFVAVVSGTAAMLVIALLFYGISKLQSSGNVEIKNAVGKVAEVYLTIPAKRVQTGKVSLTIQDRYREFNAVTDDEQEITTGMKAKVCGIVDTSTLLVKKL